MSHKIIQHGQSRKRSPWPIGLALGGVALLAITLFAFMRGNPSPKAKVEVTGPQSLQVDKEKVDLGDIKLGQTVSVSFQLTNTGSQPLQFTEPPYIEVKAGC